MISLYKKFASGANMDNIPYQYGLSIPGHSFEYIDVNPSDPNIHIYTTLKPPKKPRKKLMAIIIGIIVVIIVIMAMDVTIFSKPMVTISAVDLTILYGPVPLGHNSEYLGYYYRTLPGFNATPGSIVEYNITLTSTARNLTHSITSIYTPTSGFSIISVSPSLPYSFPPGSTFTLTLFIKTPDESLWGFLHIDLKTS